MRSRSQSFSFCISLSSPHQVLAVILVLFLFPRFASTQDNQQEKKPGGPDQAQTVIETDNAKMQEVVVIASRYPEEVGNVPTNVSVITANDIKNSTAVNVPDLLRAQAGINVSDFTGSKRRYLVDMRGFGDTSQMNTLAMIDGRRLTQSELVGTDWGLIPLDRIERIEIVRGGRGSVLYGDNATAGVINIVTKQGEKTRIGAAVNVGSYKTLNTSGYAEGKVWDLSYALTGRYDTTSGYRMNGDVDSRDGGANLKYSLSDSSIITFSTGYHKDNSGLPGALKESDFAKGLSRDEFSIFPRLILSAGYRYDRAKFESSFTPDFTFDEQAVSACIVYKFKENSSVFANYGHGFRYPVLDELFNYQSNSVVILQPQTSDSYEVGAKSQFTNKLAGSVTLFRIVTENEIFFDPSSGFLGSNSNLDGKTRRNGIEVSAFFKPFDWAGFTTQYTHLNPKITSGQYADKYIPGVPQDTASIGGVFTAKGWTLSVTGIYVGERSFINDFQNKFDDLNGYFIVSAKLKYKWRMLNCVCGC